ncbi:MAG: iron ABC transporter permease [Bacteroidota bacterium]|nr:iron ABC transporter permease [Bacteroidota bacterium]
MFKSNIYKFIILIFLFTAGTLLSLIIGGSQPLNLSDTATNSFIFWQIRLPKTITAILAGSTLSIAGLILQLIFRNPLAGPYVLGVSSGASLFVAITFLAGNTVNIFSNYFFGKSLVVMSSIIGSLAVTFFILVLSKKVNSNVILLLIGLMLAQICSAVQGFLEYFADPNSLKSFVIWGMGSLGGTTLNDLLIYSPIVIICLTAIFFFVKPLTAFLFGEHYATNSGIDYNRNRFYLIFLSSILTGVTTAFCGPIAFIGIAVPILSRMIFVTSNQKIHLISCILIGSIILLFSDVVCYNLSKTSAMPINMIITFVGAPLVIYLLFKNKQW